MTRKVLDRLYDAAGYLAAFFMVGILAMVLASVLGRMAGFNLRGSDAYAGYAMAAASFLAIRGHSAWRLALWRPCGCGPGRPAV